MATAIPFVPGALYNRRDDLHARFGGQRQGGISTPADEPVIFIFTGEAGKAHGYSDFWETDQIFHYFGEGQRGDMAYRAGNQAILRHGIEGKRLLLFQAMGHGKPYRFLGEMRLLDVYEKQGIPDTAGTPRKAIVFKLTPVDSEPPVALQVMDSGSALAIADTVALQTTEIRKKQALFRRRLVTVEKGCRITGIRDLRFVRASHIKPWAACKTGDERTDGCNGLLLTPSADHLFDRGWISFQPDGRLLSSPDLPVEVQECLGLDLSAGRRCGSFHDRQQQYLQYHRDEVFKKKYAQQSTSRDELMKAIAG
jgi:5-methylcytosine-specific restriction protein A